MSGPDLTLVVGEYNSSSWSLSAWLILRLTGLPFQEIRVPLGQYETAKMVRDYSPSGLLPVLIAGKLRVWDTLAIGEYLCEFDQRLWPEDPRHRALGRAICAEIHGGFHDLFTFLPMDLVSRFSSPGMVLRGVERDVDRICSIWEEYRVRNSTAGPFMFGNFTIVDAVMAPIASRLVTHGIELPSFAEDYVDSVMSWPDMALWQGHAAEESDEAATMPLDIIARECPTSVQAVVSSAVLYAGQDEPRPASAADVPETQQAKHQDFEGHHNDPAPSPPSSSPEIMALESARLSFDQAYREASDEHEPQPVVQPDGLPDRMAAPDHSNRPDNDAPRLRSPNLDGEPSRPPAEQRIAPTITGENSRPQFEGVPDRVAPPDHSDRPDHDAAQLRPSDLDGEPSRPPAEERIAPSMPPESSDEQLAPRRLGDRLPVTSDKPAIGGDQDPPTAAGQPSAENDKLQDTIVRRPRSDGDQATRSRAPAAIKPIGGGTRRRR